MSINSLYIKNKEILNKFKTKCCICGEDSTCCLETHHIKDKKFNISQELKTIPTLELIKELKKCICVCKNCHAKLHNNLITYE